MASQTLSEDASKHPSLKNSTDDQDPEAAKESTVGGDQVMTKKRERKEIGEEENGRVVEEKRRKVFPMVSPLDRPSREKKSVERYAAQPPPRGPATRTLEIPQGSGEKLKDIPNVPFKLSKRKADESLRVLHKILFGRASTVHFLKRNILQFSGFVWSKNEEKDRLKVKEKLDKCNKDMLLDLSDLLDIHTSKTTTKKEDILAKLLEFLESPHVTREVILSEKKRKGKRRSVATKGNYERGANASTDDGRKKVKLNLKDQAKKKRREHANDDKKGKSADEDETSVTEEKNGHSESEAEDGQNETEMAKELSDGRLKMIGPSSSKTKADSEGKPKSLERKASLSKGKKESSKMKKDKFPIKTTLEDESKLKPEMSKAEDKKKGKSKAARDSKEVSGSKKDEKFESSIAGKKQGKKKEVSVVPNREQLSAVLSEILKEVDFNVVTLADIIRKLGAHFDTDLMNRKAEIKSILEELINNMLDDDGPENEG